DRQQPGDRPCPHRIRPLRRAGTAPAAYPGMAPRSRQTRILRLKIALGACVFVDISTFDQRLRIPGLLFFHFDFTLPGPRAALDAVESRKGGRIDDETSGTDA